MNIEKLVAEIIPPSDYQHRNGFNNIPLINKLTNEQKKKLENALIQKLNNESEREVDTLVVDTLAYLKSHQALPVLRQLLEKRYNDMTSLIIAAAIFEISGDDSMIESVIDTTNSIDNKKDAYYSYKQTSAFYYLAKFKNDKIDRLLEEYAQEKDYLVSYNAKRALGRLIS